MSNAVQTVLDFINPRPNMFEREGENPISAVIAAIPTHSELVTAALEQLNVALMMHIAPENILLMLEDQIQLNSGKVIQLGEHSLFFSLVYPTAPGRIFEMELSAPAEATLH